MKRRVTTLLACVLLGVVLLAPSALGIIASAAWLRVPVDGIAAVALVLALPPKARRGGAIAAGAALGLLAVAKILGLGFSAVLDRPFEPLADWQFLGSGVDFLKRSMGDTGAIALAIGAVVLTVGLAVLVALAFLRVSELLARRRAATGWTLGGLSLVWLVCLATGAQLVSGVPVAGHDLYDRGKQVVDGLLDRQRFQAQIAADASDDEAGQSMLGGLRGKDVILAFVESYGRSALESRELSPRIRATLEQGSQRLRQLGFASRSGWLTSPTAGGGSWLAHSTLQSGLWVNDQRRYNQVLASDRMTLTGAFHRAGWRTVGWMPGNNGEWPEGQRFYHFDRIYASADVGYRGDRFAFDSIPDQFSLSALQRAERTGGGGVRPPVMATIPLLSSHAPWDPVPRMVGWPEVADGTVFDNGDAADLSADVFSRDRSRVRGDYAKAVAYSLESLLSYVEHYGGDDLVLVFLGDHQPAPLIAGPGANRDVPITIVAKVPGVLGRVAAWGWDEGLMPGPKAPVWRMDSFRDRFLTAFAR
jgi:hypothetical protein